jgi:uncharacterized protein
VFHALIKVYHPLLFFLPLQLFLAIGLFRRWFKRVDAVAFFCLFLFAKDTKPSTCSRKPFSMKLITLCFLLITSSVLAQDIFKTIDTKDYVGLEKILQAGAPTEQYNDKGLTPLWVAVFENDTTILNLLLTYRADINLLEKKGIHPIMIGCLTNAYESVRILLKNGVDVNWKSSATRNQQPIRFASQGGSVKLVKLLLAHGANMEATPDDKCTPLMAALHAKKFDIAEYYFVNNANVNAIGRDGETVIHEAIMTGNPEMVKLALQYKAPLNIKTPEGKTTMQLAKQSGNAEIKELIKNAVNGK